MFPSPEDLGLGNPIAEYTASTRRTAAGGVVFMLAAALCIAVSIGSYLQGDYSARLLIIMGIMALAFLGGAVWQFSLAIGNRDLRIVVFDQGLSRTRHGKTDSLRWDEITTVYQEIVDQHRYGARVNTSHVYRVTLQDGRKVVFNDVIRNVQALGETIQKEATARLLPKAAQTLASGGSLTFGKLILSREGLGTAREVVPWSEVDSVQRSAGWITVKRQGKSLAGASQTAAKTPNLLVFMSLVEQFVGVSK